MIPLSQGYLSGMSERDRRRWARLQPDSLTESSTELLDGQKSIKARLIDFSPGGISLELPASLLTKLPSWPRIRLRVGFRGVERVALPARIVSIDAPPGEPIRVGFAWIQDPPVWTNTERREFPRLGVSREDGFAIRVFNEHIHGLWTRASILDLSSDRGIRIEGIGGPIWMLPGMTVDVHLDLPVIHELPLHCQVLWVRPDQSDKVFAGLRVLDLESPSLQALDEWIAISGIWNPRQLVSRGFASPSIPGQYRYRSAESALDRELLIAHLDSCSGRPTGFGFETQPVMACSDATLFGYIGCWDGQRLVASIAFDLSPEKSDGDPDVITLCRSGFELDWFEPEILRGLWSQALRLFIASRRPSMRLWCPIGRERLFAMLGMHPIHPSGQPGNWYELRRDTVLFGTGMSAFTWFWVYGEVSGFHARQGNPVGVRKRMARLLRIALNTALAEVLLPSKKRRIRRELRAWCEDATSEQG